MTSPQIHFPNDKEAQSVFEGFEYGPKAEEVGKGLRVNGYKKLLGEGLPDDPVIIKDHFNGQWECEGEAIKDLAAKLNVSETCIKGIWSEVKEAGRLTVAELDDGGVVIYESPDESPQIQTVMKSR